MKCKKCKSTGWIDLEMCDKGECPHCCELPLGDYIHKKFPQAHKSVGEEHE